MTEHYRFEHRGAPLVADIDAVDIPTTSETPNLRVLEGSWKTWRVEVDPKVSGLAGVRLMRAVAADGGEHPIGMPPSDADGNGIMMITSAGYLYRIPTGWGLAARFYSPDEWAFLAAEWEKEVHAEGRRA